MMKGGEGGIEKRKIEREGRGERKVKKDRRGDDNATPHTHIQYYIEYARYCQLDY